MKTRISFPRLSCRQVQSRRDALRVAAGVGVAAGLGWASGTPEAFAAEPLAVVRDHRVSVPSTVPKLVVAHGADPAKNVRAALDRMGGMARFVRAGEVVLVKPNVGWDRTPVQGANTNPDVVEAVVLACRDAGAREVIVIDGSVHDPTRSFHRSGVRAAAQRAGARVIMPDETQYVQCEIPGLDGRWEVLSPFAHADKIINVPIAKHHGSARVTAGMKNWIGITRKNRSAFHAGLDQSIASLAALMRPTLTIVDATRVLLRNGPQGGNLDDVVRRDRIAIGLDPVALDAWVTDLLGARRSAVGYLKLAEARGLGKIELGSPAVEIKT